MNPFELTGRADTHVIELDENNDVLLHRATVAAFRAMREAAAREGLDMVAMSGFRGFDRQSGIWDSKWKGKRTLYDRESRPVDHASLSPLELVHTILIWSALPGASRHHWGTDIDVYDGKTKPDGYIVQLLPEEYAKGGFFHGLFLWLLENMGRFGFFLPYREYKGGISPEPWHISHAPVSLPALKDLTPGLLEETVRSSNIQGRETVLEMIPEIHRRYVANICPPSGGGTAD